MLCHLLILGRKLIDTSFSNIHKNWHYANSYLNILAYRKWIIIEIGRSSNFDIVNLHYFRCIKQARLWISSDVSFLIGGRKIALNIISEGLNIFWSFGGSYSRIEIWLLFMPLQWDVRSIAISLSLTNRLSMQFSV